MAFKKWGRQAFLNPADSNDDGWYKFSIRPRAKGRGVYGGTIGFGVQYIISDCSNKIYLEFEPDNVSVEGDGACYSIPDARAALRSSKVRRKKIQDFAAAVAASAEKIIEALDEFDSQVEVSIQKRLDRDAEEG